MFLPSECWPFSLLWLSLLVAAAGCSREFGLSAVAAVALLFICHCRTVFSDYTISKNTARTAFCVYRRRPRRRCPKVSVAQQTVDPSSKQVSHFLHSPSLSLSAAFSFLFPFWRAFLFRCELSYAINSNHTPEIIMQPKPAAVNFDFASATTKFKVISPQRHAPNSIMSCRSRGRGSGINFIIISFEHHFAHDLPECASRAWPS